MIENEIALEAFCRPSMETEFSGGPAVEFQPAKIVRNFNKVEERALMNNPLPHEIVERYAHAA